MPHSWYRSRVETIAAILNILGNRSKIEYIPHCAMPHSWYRCKIEYVSPVQWLILGTGVGQRSNLKIRSFLVQM